MTQIETHEQIEMLAPSSLKEGRKEQSGWRWLIAALVMLAVIGVLGAEIRSRVKAATNLRAVTSQMAVPSVSVVLPKQTAPAQEVVLPGNMQPYISSPIYARTDGYLKKWYFDIGANVKAGDLLAIIQTPEVDEQLDDSQQIACFYIRTNIEVP